MKNGEVWEEVRKRDRRSDLKRRGSYCPRRSAGSKACDLENKLSYKNKIFTKY